MYLFIYNSVPKKRRISEFADENALTTDSKGEFYVAISNVKSNCKKTTKKRRKKRGRKKR